MSGRAAIQLVKENLLAHNNKRCDYVLILMDCQMEDIDGYQASEEIRDILYQHRLPQPIIIAVTAHAEDWFINKAIFSGMN